MDETRERFLRAVVARVPLDRLVEMHLFPPIRQGVLEAGVAVVAAIPEAPPAAPTGEPVGLDEPAAAEESAPDAAPAAAEESAPDAAPAAADEAPPSPAPVRHVVYTARYRWTRKGPDRGKWEVEVVAEADAPLVTVEAVVRGVRERTAEAGDPERLTGEGIAAALAEADQWATTAP